MLTTRRKALTAMVGLVPAIIGGTALNSAETTPNSQAAANKWKRNASS